MHNSESSLSYCPDFSDICSEDSSFWDFLKNNEDENEMAPNQEDHKTSIYLVESEDVQYRKKDSVSKLQEYSRTKLSDKPSGIKQKDPKIEKSKNSCIESISFKVQCQENNLKNVSNEDEDEFWDFLKSDNVSSIQETTGFWERHLSSAELEEMRSLSSSTPFSTDGTPSCISGSNLRYKHCASVEIFRDLDLILSEADSAPGLLKEGVEKNCSAAGNAEKVFTSSEMHKNNKSYSPNDRVPNSVELSKQSTKSCEITDRKQMDSVKYLSKVGYTNIIFPEKTQLSNTFETTVQACSKGNKLNKQNLSPGKKYVSNLSIRNHLLNEVNSKCCESSALSEHNTIVGTNSSFQRIPDQSNPRVIQPQSRKKEEMQLPVISSIFSISSCPDIFNQQEIPADQQNSFELKDCSNNSSIRNVISAPTGHNTIVSDVNDSSCKPNSFFEVNSNVPRTTENTSPWHVRNARHFMQEDSPKNSVFRITDCNTTVSDIQESAESQTNSLNYKRQKTNNMISSSKMNCQGMLVSENLSQKMHPTVPVKYIVLPTSTLGANNTTVSNPAPLYLILPKSAQTDNSQNSELVFVINNNNLIANNTVMKTSTSLTNCTVPVSTVTCSSKIVGNQIPNYAYQSMGQNTQQASLPTVNVVGLLQNPDVTNAPYNYSGSTLMNNSVLKSSVNNTRKFSLSSDSRTAKINILPTSLSRSSTLTDNGKLYSVPAWLPSNISETRLPAVSILANNSFQLPNTNSETDQQPLSTMSQPFIAKASQSNQFGQSMSSGTIPVQHFKQVRQQNIKPIKSISLGKDKNAIQQISIPLKMDSLTDPQMLNRVYDNLGISTNYEGYCTINTQSKQVIPNTDKNIQSSQKTPISMEHQQNFYRYGHDIFSFVPHKRNSDGVLVKRNLITNETEVVNKNLCLNTQPSSHLRVSNSVNLNESSGVKASKDKINSFISNSSHQDTRPTQRISTCISSSRHQVDRLNETNSLTKMNVTKSNDNTSDSQIQPSEAPKNSLAALKELFPPPISMIPVCVMQTVQTANKPTVSKILVLQSSSAIDNEAAKLKTQRKSAAKKSITKPKKQERKTVKQLLEERHKKTADDEMSRVYKTGVGTKTLRPIYKINADGTLVPTALPVTENKSLNTFSYITKSNATERISALVTGSNKRPNIMMLPSKTKVVQSKILKNDTGKKDPLIVGPSRASESSYNLFDSPDFLLETITPKDCKPRYYDMCELRIGYFKVEDDIDSCGRFRSKFKVLFTKRQFVYEFPATNCNQVDLNNCYACEEMVRIQVPFQTLVAMNVYNRQISIQVNRCPQICLKKSYEESAMTLKGKDYAEVNCLWTDVIQNSLLHKIKLRKRQADNLKTYLCQFDSNFFFLFDIGNNMGLTSTTVDVDTSPFEEELASTDLRKVYQKNKKNIIRRLPQWDSQAIFEPLESIGDDDHFLSSNQICSCRISCKSLRCSCVKAAKSCSIGGTACLCTNCDNPLNVLDSFGINLDFSLSDRCLFQNIYRIPKLRSFLQRCVKLSCCNTVARVLDCIPGTILCPNTECNESLEFSWCQVIICYPERNPRNHCSFCGLCCFSNKRHCPICNRCYIVTPKSPDCPNCRGSGIAMKPIYKDINEEDNGLQTSLPFTETLLTKPCSKPEIILLDNSLNEKLETSSMKKEDIINIKTDEPDICMDNKRNENIEKFIEKELIVEDLHKHDNVLKNNKSCEMSQENNPARNYNKPCLKEFEIEIDDSKDDIDRILILDISLNAKLKTSMTKEDIINLKVDQRNLRTGNKRNEDIEKFLEKELMVEDLHKHHNLLMNNESFKKSQENNPASNDDKPDFKECKVEIDDCKDVILMMDTKDDQEYVIPKNEADTLSENDEQSQQPKEMTQKISSDQKSLTEIPVSSI